MTDIDIDTEEALRRAKLVKEDALAALPRLVLRADGALEASALDPSRETQAALKRAEAALKAGREDLRLAEARVRGLTQRLADERLVDARTRWTAFSTQARTLGAAGHVLQSQASLMFRRWLTEFHALDDELIAHAAAAGDLTRAAATLPPEAGPRIAVYQPYTFTRNHTAASANAVRAIEAMRDYYREG